MAAYEFPVADFSALADIPRVYQAGVQDRLRKSIFEDLTSASTPKDFETAGLRALKAGLEPEANQLFTQAATRRGIEQRGAADELLRAWVAANQKGIGGTAAAAAGAPPVNLGIVEYPNPIAAEPASSPAAPTVPVSPWAQPAVPYLPGPRSEAAPVAPVAAIPPSLNALPSPTEQVLAAAEGAAPPIPQRQQLAGPPPAPDTAPAAAPGAAAPVPFPLWMQSIPAAPIGPSAPAASSAPAAPPLNPSVLPGMPAGEPPTISPAGLSPPPPPSGVPPMGAAPPTRRIVETPEQALTGRAAESTIANSPLMSAPPKAANLPGVRLIFEQARNAMRQQNLSAEVQSFHMENIQRSLDGKPPYSYSEYQQFKETTGKRYDVLSTTAEGFAKEGQAGHQLSETLRGMKELATNPLFVPGAPYDPNDKSIAGRMDSMRKGIANVADSLRVMGVPESILPGKDYLDSLNTPTALREAFTTLAHRGVIQALGGSLSRGISGPDRVYMTQAFPDLIKSKAGIDLIINVLEKGAERSQIAGNIANKYMADKDFRGNAAELRLLVGDAIDKYDAAHGSILTRPDGSPTAVKSAMDRIIADQAKGQAPFPGSSERVLPPTAERPAVPPATPLIGSADYYRPLGGQ